MWCRCAIGMVHGVLSGLSPLCVPHMHDIMNATSCLVVGTITKKCKVIGGWGESRVKKIFVPSGTPYGPCTENKKLSCHICSNWNISYFRPSGGTNPNCLHQCIG